MGELAGGLEYPAVNATWAGAQVVEAWNVSDTMNRNSRRKAKAELKICRQSGEKLVNPKSKRRTAWWGGISKRVPVKSL
jgi:hypothetical protein